MATSKDYSDDEDDNWLKDVQDADVFVMYKMNVFHISANEIYYGPWY
jgi:hypothetical protein